MIPGNKVKPQAQVQVNIKDTETIVCEKSGNGLFIQSFFLKKISAIVSPTGKESIVPIQVYSCGNCGKVPKVFIEGAGLGSLEEQPKEDALSRPDLMG